MSQKNRRVYRFKSGNRGQCISYDEDGKISFPHKDGTQPNHRELWECEICKEFDKFNVLKLIRKLEDEWKLDVSDFYYYKAIIINSYDGKRTFVTVEHRLNKGDLQLSLKNLYEGDYELAESIFNLLLTRLPDCVKESAKKEFTEYIDLYIQAKTIRSKTKQKI